MYLVPDGITWLLIVICLMLSAFFSATETALTCFNKFRTKIKADDGIRSAKLILKASDKFDKSLITILIGNDLAAIAISSLSTIVFYKYFSNAGIPEWASLTSTIIMTFVVYILGDTLPKTIAKAVPDSILKINIYILYGFLYLFWPVAILFELFNKLIIKIFRLKEPPTMTEEDFSNVIEQTEEEGVLEENEKEIIQSALEFADTNVKEVLTKKEKMFAIDLKELTHDKLNEVLLDTKYSRIPIYNGNIDNIVGVLYVKTYLMAYLKNPKVSIKSLIKRPYFVLTNIMIDDLLEGLKKKQTHIAFVYDKNRSLVGMVTMEDILEEIVKDIAEPVQNSSLKKAGTR